MAIIIDASVFCAYANQLDVHHKNAQRVIAEILSNKYGEPIITDHLFDEIVSVLLRRTNKKIALDAGNIILDSEIFFIH